MLFCVVGLSFRTAPIESRERLSFEESEIPEALRLLKAKDELAECVILSTCNRVEIYGLLTEPRPQILRDFLRDFHKYSDKLDNLVYMHRDHDAVRHLCVVAGGLDSMVLGEPQIFGQVKDAFARAVQLRAAGHVLDHVFSQAFGIVKKVRTRTKVGEKNVSVSYTSVRLAESIFGSMEQTRVLVLGAGEMGELTVRNMISSGAREVVVANRTFQRAVALAERFSGTPIMLHELPEYLPKVDIVVSSVPVPDYVIKRPDIESVMAGRGSRPIFFVDIAVPRSIDPGIASIGNVHLYNIDDLKAVAVSNAEAREREAERAMNMIDERVPQIMEYVSSCDIIPTLVSIRAKAEEIRRDDTTRIIESISAADRGMVESLTKSIVNKILHHSEVKLRQYHSSLKSA